MQSNSVSKQSANLKPIGVMDSGVGGISVLRHVRRLMPNENIVYVADSQYAPYGNLSPAEITARCFTIADFLITQGAKALVVACNTATAASIQLLRDQYMLPIIGMEPAVKPAALASQNGVIGVLATVGTLKSAQYAALLENYGNGVQVLAQGCNGLVECVERGEVTQTSTHDLIKQYMLPLLESGADTIVLGCTHYPFLRPLIAEIAGDDIAIIDTGEAVAKHLQDVLQKHSLGNATTSKPEITVWSNSQTAKAEQVIKKLWGGDDIKVKQLR